MLEVDKIDTYYGEFQALKEVSVKVDDGELVVIFGPNGHGKSTLPKPFAAYSPLPRARSDSMEKK